MSVEEQLDNEIKRLEESKRRVRSIKELGLMESLCEALKDLEAVKEDIGRLEELGVAQQDLMTRFNSLDALVKQEIQDRRAQRARENETLDLVNKYLKDWM